MEAAERMRAMVNGYQVSHAVSVAAALGLSDLLAEGPRTAAQLVSATGCDEAALLRLLRALATVGVYEPVDDGRFASTELGEQLRTDAPGSIAGWAVFVGRPYYQQAWSALADSVRTGENAFVLVDGVPVWEYRGRHPVSGRPRRRVRPAGRRRGSAGAARRAWSRRPLRRGRRGLLRRGARGRGRLPAQVDRARLDRRRRGAPAAPLPVGDEGRRRAAARGAVAGGGARSRGTAFSDTDVFVLEAMPEPPAAP